MTENGSNPRYQTLRGEFVKSLSEKYIADFLYLHQVQYEYEHPLFLDGQMIKPDFYLPSYDTYIEFWGILEDPNYYHSFKWKVEKYKAHNIRFIALQLEDLPALEKNFEIKLKTALGTSQ